MESTVQPVFAPQSGDAAEGHVTPDDEPTDASSPHTATSSTYTAVYVRRHGSELGGCSRSMLNVELGGSKLGQTPAEAEPPPPSDADQSKLRQRLRPPRPPPAKEMSHMTSRHVGRQ